MHWIIRWIKLPQIHQIFHLQCLEFNICMISTSNMPGSFSSYLNQSYCCNLAVQWWYQPSWKLGRHLKLIPWPSGAVSSIHKAAGTPLIFEKVKGFQEHLTVQQMRYINSFIASNYCKGSYKQPSSCPTACMWHSIIAAISDILYHLTS